MKRRQAIQGMALMTAGAVIMPACDFAPLKLYDKMPLDKKQRKVLGQLADLILPKGEPVFETPESTVDFIMTRVNDCYDPKDIERFLIGFQEIEMYLETNYPKRIDKLEPTEYEEILSFLIARGEEGVGVPADDQLPQAYFFNTTKYLTQQHFTTSEGFLKQQMEYEFAPGRFLGCVPA